MFHYQASDDGSKYFIYNTQTHQQICWVKSQYIAESVVKKLNDSTKTLDSND
jgi:hypothetical protein